MENVIWTIKMNHSKNRALEGLRGWAAAMVVLSHLVFTFWAAAQTGNPEDSASKWDMRIFNSPLSFAYGGTFAVCLFFVMSGYVLTIKFVRTGDSNVITALFIKRYFRLMPPVIVATLFAFLILRSGLMANGNSELSTWYRSLYQIQPEFLDAFTDATFRTFLLTGHANYDPPLWTMRIEFIGSMLCFSWCLLTRGMSYRWLVDIVLISIIINILGADGVYLSLFIIGAAIARINLRNLSWWMLLALCMVGVWLGGYHSTSSFHHPLATFQTIFGAPVWGAMSRSIAAVSIFFAVLNGTALRNFFSRFDRFGARSFSLYLVHFPIMTSLGAVAFGVAREAGINYALSASLSCSTIAAASYIAAIAFHKLVDAPSIRFSEWVISFFFPALSLQASSRHVSQEQP